MKSLMHWCLIYGLGCAAETRLAHKRISKKSRNGRKATRNKTISELIPRYFIEIYDRVADAFAYMPPRRSLSSLWTRRRRTPEKRANIYCRVRSAPSILDKKSPRKVHVHAASFSLPLSHAQSSDLHMTIY